MLHNLCLKYGVPYEDNIIYDGDEDVNANVNTMAPNASNYLGPEAKRIRDAIRDGL